MSLFLEISTFVDSFNSIYTIVLYRYENCAKKAKCRLKRILLRHTQISTDVCLSFRLQLESKINIYRIMYVIDLRKYIINY